MSYSFLEPEWPACCECKYDEARDEMDRDDCPFHCDLVDGAVSDRVQIAKRMRPARSGELVDPAA